MKKIIGYFHTMDGEPANFSEQHNQLFFTFSDIVVKPYNKILSERRIHNKKYSGRDWNIPGAKRVVIQVQND